MTVRRTRIRSAFSLVEAMLAAVILIIAVLGTSLFRYTPVLSAKEADTNGFITLRKLEGCTRHRNLSSDSQFRLGAYDFRNQPVRYRGRQRCHCRGPG